MARVFEISRRVSVQEVIKLAKEKVGRLITTLEYLLIIHITHIFRFHNFSQNKFSRFFFRMCVTRLSKEGGKEGAEGGEEVCLHLHLEPILGQDCARGWFQGDCFQVVEKGRVRCGHCNDQTNTVLANS